MPLTNIAKYIKYFNSNIWYLCVGIVTLSHAQSLVLRGTHTIFLSLNKECENIRSEVSLLHGKSREVVYKFFSKPRPLGKEKTMKKDDCLSVTTKSISSRKHFDEERREYNIRVKANFYAMKSNAYN